MDPNNTWFSQTWRPWIDLACWYIRNEQQQRVLNGKAMSNTSPHWGVNTTLLGNVTVSIFVKTIANRFKFSTKILVEQIGQRQILFGLQLVTVSINTREVSETHRVVVASETHREEAV